MRTRHDQRDGAGSQAGRGAAAEPVGEHHGVVGRADLVDLGLQDGAQVGRVVVEAAPVEAHVHDVRRAGGAEVDAARQDLAGERQDALAGCGQ